MANHSLLVLVVATSLACHATEPRTEPSREPSEATRAGSVESATPTIVGHVTRAGAPVAGVRVSYSAALETAVVSDDAGAFELVVAHEDFAAAPAIHVVLTEADGKTHAVVLRNSGARIEASFELGDVVGVELRGASPEDQAWVDASTWAEREWNEWAAAHEDVAAHIAQWERVAATIAAERDEYRRGLLMAAQFRIGGSDPDAGLDRSDAASQALDELGLDDPRWSIQFAALLTAVYESGRLPELAPRLDALISEHPQPDVAGFVAVSRYISTSGAGEAEAAAAIWQRWLDRPSLAQTQFAQVMLTQGPTRVLAPGQPMPELCVEELDGGRLCTADLRGKPSVIEFWATWCHSCPETAAKLRDARATLGDEAPRFLSVEIYSNDDEVRSFLAKDPLPWPQGWVVESEREAVRSRLQISGVPTLLLVDADGIIVASSPELLAENLVAEVRALPSSD